MGYADRRRRRRQAEVPDPATPWNPQGPTTIGGDLALVRDRLRAVDFGPLTALPAIAGDAGPGAARAEWTATGPGTVDDFVAEAIRNGAPPPTTAIFRGAEVVALGGLIVVPWRAGVVAGTPDAVARAMDREEEKEAQHDSDA